MSHPLDPAILSKVFVTGATGHTGSRLVARLLELGHHVTCLTRGGDRRQFLPAHERLNIIEGDIESGEPTWADSLRGCAVVFHIAHIRFAPRIIAACRTAGVRRLICMSSTRRFTAFPEQTAKWVIEGESALESSGLDYTVLRPAMIYGWERDNNLEKLVRYLRKRRIIPLVRGGRNLMQPVFVEDVVDALLRALAMPQTAGRMLTIAGPQPISLRELIETVAREMKVNPIWIPIPFALAMTGAAILEMLPGRALVTRDQIRRLLEDKAFDITEARTALGDWSPRSFEEGIREKVGRLSEPTTVDEKEHVMSRRFKILAGCSFFLMCLVFLVLWGVVAFTPTLEVGTAFKAKNLCSSVFVSGRDADWVDGEDLSFGPLVLIGGSVNHEKKTASASFFGHADGMAVYREGLGCTIGSDPSWFRDQAKDFSPPAKPDMSNVAWPQGDLLPAEIPPALANPAKLKEAIEYAFDEPDSSNERRTRAILVIHDGRIIAEQYSKRITQDMPLGGYSMTKSVTNALVGILVKQGKLDIMKPAPVRIWSGTDYSGLNFEDHKQITLDHLLRMSSGLEFSEVYDDFGSDVVLMLYRRTDAGEYAARKPMEKKPDEEWYYSSGTTNIISRIVRDTVGGSDADYWNFPRKELFEKIGMHTTTMEPDAYGTFVGSSFMYATARDWARFGMLYLNDGVWNGERILPEGWVKYSTTPTPKAPKGEYGAQFWLNAGAPENPADRELKDVPRDAYMMSGYEGQSVIIIPSRNLVIVRLGQSRPFGAFDRNLFTALILEAIGLPKKTEE